MTHFFLNKNYFIQSSSLLKATKLTKILLGTNLVHNTNLPRFINFDSLNFQQKAFKVTYACKNICVPLNYFSNRCIFVLETVVVCGLFLALFKFESITFIVPSNFCQKLEGKNVGFNVQLQKPMSKGR